MKNFKDFTELQKHIRKNGTSDYVKVNNIVYTMDEYDEAGKEISYGNKKKGKGFIVKTEDRYKKGFEDAEIEEDESSCFRNDIEYWE